MKFRNHTLENGLEIVAECNDAVHSLGVGFCVRIGERDETDAVEFAGGKMKQNIRIESY